MPSYCSAAVPPSTPKPPLGKFVTLTIDLIGSLELAMAEPWKELGMDGLKPASFVINVHDAPGATDVFEMTYVFELAES